MIDEIDVHGARLQFRADGLVCVRYEAGLDVDLALTRRLHDVHIACMEGQPPQPVLIDLRGVRSFTREARRESAGPRIAPYVAAVGVLQASPVAAVIYNWVVRLQRPSFPTRLFSDASECEAWLLPFAVPRHAEG